MRPTGCSEKIILANVDYKRIHAEMCPLFLPCNLKGQDRKDGAFAMQKFL